MTHQFMRGNTVSQLFQLAVVALGCSMVLASPAFAAADQVNIRIRTFVHQQDYLADALSCGGAFFIKGDNRVTAPTGGTSRTTFSLTRQFKNAAGAVSTVNSFSKSAGVTNGLDFFKNVISTATAPTTGMTAAVTTNTGSTTTWVLGHAVADPICQASPALNYNLTVKVTSAHVATVTGSHDAFPDLEIYATKDAGAHWKKIYSAVGDNSLCLNQALPGCAQKPVNTSVAF